MDISKDIRLLLDEERKLERITEEKLKTAPQGYLKAKKCGKYTKLYYQKDLNDSFECYLGKDKQALIKALEERDYCKKLEKVVQEREKALQTAALLIEKMPSADAVFYGIPAERRNLIEPIESKREMTKEEVEAWNEVNRRKDPPAPVKYYVTKGGEKVRSKSEVIIADRLSAADVPYQYESLLQMADEYFFDNYIWMPDFKVLNVKSGQTWYWEHFGMADDPSYCSASIFKMETYAKFGIFPGKNLIITAETKAHPINTEYVDTLINEYLLR